MAILGPSAPEMRLECAVDQQAMHRALDQGVRGQVAGVLGGYQLVDDSGLGDAPGRPAAMTFENVPR